MKLNVYFSFQYLSLILHVIYIYKVQNNVVDKLMIEYTDSVCEIWTLFEYQLNFGKMLLRMSCSICSTTYINLSNLTYRLDRDWCIQHSFSFELISNEAKTKRCTFHLIIGHNIP